MELTVTGLVLIPVGVGAAMISSPLPLLYLVIFFAPFSATALVNFTGPAYGLQPAYFFGFLLLVRTGWHVLRGGRIRLHVGQADALLPFVIFFVAAVASIALIPLYGNGILVLRPSGALESLRVTGENLTQLLYLVYVVAIAAGIAGLKLGPDELRRALRVFLLSAAFVSVWGWLQVALFMSGLPYPDFLFNNSASFKQSFGQVVEAVGLKRMSSVAPEPSALARFLLVPTFISYYAVYVGDESLLSARHARGLAILLTLTLLATTSSTALIGLAAGFPVFLVFMFLGRRRMAADRGRMRRGAQLLALCGVVAPVLLYAVARIWLGLTNDQLAAAFEALLLDKLSSTSGQTRIAGAAHGIGLFATHPLLGVGWGSNRTFDLTTNLLAGVGIIGTLAFAWAHAGLGTRLYRLRARLAAAGRRGAFVLPEALLVGLAILLLGKAISEPDLVYLDHWIIVGLLLAALGWQIAPRAGSTEREPGARG